MRNTLSYHSQLLELGLRLGSNFICLVRIDSIYPAMMSCQCKVHVHRAPHSLIQWWRNVLRHIKVVG